MTEQAVTIADDEIIIRSQYFSSKENVCSNKDVLADILGTHYRSQKITVLAHDGENLKASGLLTLLSEFAIILNIPEESVTIETHDVTLTGPFTVKHIPLGLFQAADKLIPEFEKDTSNAKFVGTVIGRFTPTRLRLAYELDQTFPNDNYLIFQGRTWLNGEPFKEVYEKEIAWYQSKVFDHDIDSSSPVGAVGFDEAYRNYPNIWNQYQIEVIIETDPVSNFWFTEKTAKCLATGKPFLLVCGWGSLAHLRHMGFETFSSVISEQYDQEPLPTKRILSIIDSLTALYNDPDKDNKIAEMYKIAERNQEHYKKYLLTQGSNV